MEDKVCSPAGTTATVIQTCSAASEMSRNDALVSDFVEQEESSIMDPCENNSSKWTNEKHSLYLKSIEASFVDQLYNSLDMLSCQTQNTNCSDAISSGQYKVLRHGYWSKKSFKRQNSHLKDATDRPHVSPGNPWVQHFRNGSRKRLSSTPTATSLQHQHPFVAEVMDQNFVDGTSSSRKRVRSSKIGHANDDQVVPQFTSAATTEIPNSRVSSKK